MKITKLMLADLAVNNDFEEIIRRGKEALMKEKMTEVDFEYKKRLGQYVEDYIQKILALPTMVIILLSPLCLFRHHLVVTTVAKLIYPTQWRATSTH